MAKIQGHILVLTNIIYKNRMLNLRELLMRSLHVKHELVPHLVPDVVSIWTVRRIYNFVIIKLLKEFFVKRMFWILICFFYGSKASLNLDE